MKTPRITVRRLMAVVIIMALSLAGGIELQRRMLARPYLEMAADQARQAAAYRRSTKPSLGRRHVEHMEVLAKYHDDLSEKYGRAALTPWSPVAPDPPEPGWKD